jgi:hypothetical protein
MNPKIRSLLDGKGQNYTLPFFWQHGEDEATLRRYMGAIYDSNIRAVCVESRPHPDFCGPLWWRDMDIILDEARKREMKVWILDDSHFPTGYANGAMKNVPDTLCHQSLVSRSFDCAPSRTLKLGKKELLHPQPSKPTNIEFFAGLVQKTPTRKFNDDQLLGAVAVRLDALEIVDLSGQIQQGRLEWTAPAGKWKVYLLHLSRNFGFHRTYINMLDRESCRVLLDAVYEPHYARYQADFGKTIAGFFSDEPELGNGHLYSFQRDLGTEIDLPWSRELPGRLEEALGKEYRSWLPLLWENGADAAATARVRYAYMDAVTRLVETDFSRQLSEWCSGHGVEYIGHLIEDNNQHARTGSSLGHFFRGLSWQHMAGVDVVTRQVIPQGEDKPAKAPFGAYDGEFYHFVLAKLGSSHAAIDPLKQGRAMCEIFGNYGWAEGVRTEKYLADHFMVRGINHFVPHAFSPKKFPDPDCPPHFYADGYDPQFRHFGALMAYMNRVCELISDGRRVTPAAVLYHGEAEWTGGTCMLMQKPARLLAEHQIDFDILPQDIFLERARYKTELGQTLRVNGNPYRVLIVPTAQFVTEAFVNAVVELSQAGFPVRFIDQRPEGICNAKDPASAQALLAALAACPAIPLEKLVECLLENNLQDITLSPASRWVRCLHYRYADGGQLFYLVNEGTEVYRGTIHLPEMITCCAYNAWDNRLERLTAIPNETGAGSRIEVELEPLKSLLIVNDPSITGQPIHPPLDCQGKRISISGGWVRSLCTAIAYPSFEPPQAVSLPDHLAEQQPKFSGFVRYENQIRVDSAAIAGGSVILEITDAHEGVEVFVNEQSCGIQIVPPFRYDISARVKQGLNPVRIEVATTLERAVGRKGLIGLLMAPKPSALSGITGEVNLYLQHEA